MKDYYQCEKCPIEQHEGIFCRCESRNIRVAKRKREALAALEKLIELDEKLLDQPCANCKNEFVACVCIGDEE